jgi:hypothetical protein
MKWILSSVAALALVHCDEVPEPQVSLRQKPQTTTMVPQQALPNVIGDAGHSRPVGSKPDDDTKQPTGNVVKSLDSLRKPSPSFDRGAEVEQARMRQQVYLAQGRCKHACGQQTHKCRMACGKAGSRAGAGFNTSQCASPCNRAESACNRRC